MTKAQRKSHKLGNVERWKRNRILERVNMGGRTRIPRYRGFSLQGVK